MQKGEGRSFGLRPFRELDCRYLLLGSHIFALQFVNFSPQISHLSLKVFHDGILGINGFLLLL
jgi:hypothetical protein